MVGSKTTKLLDAITSPDVSTNFNIQRARDETGLFYVDVTGSGLTVNVRVQGRPDSSANWFDIATFTELNLGGGTSGGTAAAVIQLFPQMRVRCFTLSGTNPVLSAWWVE